MDARMWRNGQGASRGAMFCPFLRAFRYRAGARAS
jgi:hypothetical protein